MLMSVGIPAVLDHIRRMIFSSGHRKLQHLNQEPLLGLHPTLSNVSEKMSPEQAA